MIRFFTLLLILLCTFNNAAYSRNSLLSYEQAHKGSGYDDCFSTGKIANFADFSNTYIPGVIGLNMKPPEMPMDRVIAGYVARGATAFISMTFAPTFLVRMAVEYAVMVDYCSGAFAYTAAERVNIKAGILAQKHCEGDPLQFTSAKENVALLEPEDVPYIFHCDPNYDPTYKGLPDGMLAGLISGTVTPEEFAAAAAEVGWGRNLDDAYKAEHPEAEEMVGRTWGYMGKNSESCLAIDTFANASDTSDLQDFMKENVGSIQIGYYSQTRRKFCEGLEMVGLRCVERPPDTCEFGKYKSLVLKGGDLKKAQDSQMIIEAYAYYRMHPTSGRIQLCAAEPFTFLPVILGCTTVAAPGDMANIDEFLKAFVADTRCAYLLKARTDLESLGASLPVPSNHPVRAFLASEMHFTSTVVGCIKDILAKIFIKSPTGSTYGPKPFFQQVQLRLQQMIMAALTLYVALLGIKIMSSPEPPKRAEWVMYAVKFGVVLYFALGDAWYKVEGGDVTGLYPAIIDMSEELSSMFMEAQNINDPLRFCYYPYEGKNIFSQNEIPAGGSGLVATEGSRGNSYIITTVWDLIDCKVVNYLNFGTCKYSLTGMVATWLPQVALFSGGSGIVLAIVLLIYLIFTLITVFRYTHIFILAMFTITILVFLSPIFFVFWLFEPTKQMFTQWFKMLLGYMLLPGLLFAFVSIMLATFDSIYYGDLNIDTFSSRAPDSQMIESMCLDVNSMYCKIAEVVDYANTCDLTMGSITNILTDSWGIKNVGFRFKYLKDVNSIYDPSLKLMLFAFLFYLFLDKIASFMEVLVGVKGLSGMSKGAGAIVAAPKAIATGALMGAKYGAGKASSAVGRGLGGGANFAGGKR